MNTFEDEYYFLIDTPFRKSFLELVGIKGAGDRFYEWAQLDYGDGPLFFGQAFKEAMPFKLSNVQMDGGVPVVCKKIAEVIDQYNIDGFQLFPSIIVDDNGEWHEDFYYFNCYEELDCVDFKKSEVEDYEPDSLMGHVVLKFKLRADVLEAIEEEKRMVIMLGNVLGPSLLVHKKLVDQLAQFNIEAFTFYKASEYERGIQYKCKPAVQC
ncbi:hypothetical protein L4C34_20180 [Vibrio profundum]|uniref:imm11 family protein n=1 Tax=Vibrio profundum TaxID=2910247 RepID=UPI003D121E26